MLLQLEMCKRTTRVQQISADAGSNVQLPKGNPQRQPPGLGECTVVCQRKNVVAMVSRDN